MLAVTFASASAEEPLRDSQHPARDLRPRMALISAHRRGEGRQLVQTFGRQTGSTRGERDDGGLVLRGYGDSRCQRGNITGGDFSGRSRPINDQGGRGKIAE